jgi:two-component system NarL family response regulator
MIVEDDPMLLQNLSILLGGEAGFKIVGAYRTAEDALLHLERTRPDALLTDIGLPGMSGIDFIKKASELLPDLEIMAYTVFEDKDSVFAAIKAGASGYLLKGSSPREIVEALHALYKGGAPMTPKIARKIIREFQDDYSQDQHLLTQREKDLLTCVEEALSYKEIGERLNISIHTVHTHIKNIYEKLQAKNRKDALIKARERGII